MSWANYAELVAARQRRVAAEKEEARRLAETDPLPELPQKWIEGAGVRLRESPAEEDMSRSTPAPRSSTPATQSTMSISAASRSSTLAAELQGAPQRRLAAEEDRIAELEALPELPQKWSEDAGVRLYRKEGHPQHVEQPRYREAQEPPEDWMSRSSTPATQSTASISRSSTPRSSTPASQSIMQVCQQQEMEAVETRPADPANEIASPSPCSMTLTKMRSCRPGVDYRYITVTLPLHYRYITVT